MILIKIPGLKSLVRVESIMSIEGDGNYSILHFDDGQEYTAVETLKWFEDQLTDFIRLHKHRLVNPFFVTHFERQTAKVAFVTLKDGATFSVARRRIEAVGLKLSTPNSQWPVRKRQSRTLFTQFRKNEPGQ